MHESNGVVDELTALFCTNFSWEFEHEDDDEHEDDTLVAAPPAGPRWVTERFVIAKKRVTIVERRDLSSRATPEAASAGRLA